ncbi:MAG: ABC transporter ATP-binding protein, partial [Sarcina sp.]
QRQRVALGRAIVREPKVFLMDEPLSNLDAKLRVQMRTEIAKLHKKLQTTFIYVTHDQTEAMTMGSRIVVMKDGVVQQVASPQEIYENPANMFVAGFIGSPQMNFINAKIESVSNGVAIVFGREKILLPKNMGEKLKENGYLEKEVIMGIRPEHIEDNEEYIKNNNSTTITAKIEVTELMGAESYIYAINGNNNITVRVNGSTSLKSGDTTKFALEIDKVHIFDKETEKTIL